MTVVRLSICPISCPSVACSFLCVLSRSLAVSSRAGDTNSRNLLCVSYISCRPSVDGPTRCLECLHDSSMIRSMSCKVADVTSNPRQFTSLTPAFSVSAPHSLPAHIRSLALDKLSTFKILISSSPLLPSTPVTVQWHRLRFVSRINLHACRPMSQERSQT